MIEKANIKGVSVARRVLLRVEEINKIINNKKIEEYWRMLVSELSTKTVVVKPRGDGCSAGVVRLFNQKDLATYLFLVRNRVLVVKPNTFSNQENIVHMPETATDIIFESFIETGKLRVSNGKIAHTHKSGYIEMTVGVLEERGEVRALSPSITIAESQILSVEEKFQGGTGVNITPPPKEILSLKNLNKVKDRIEWVAKALGIKGYSRIDVFAKAETGDIIVIEVNTLPGLTPSTVFYHQALAENPPIYPTQLLEKIIRNAGY